MVSWSVCPPLECHVAPPFRRLAVPRRCLVSEGTPVALRALTSAGEPAAQLPLHPPRPPL